MLEYIKIDIEHIQGGKQNAENSKIYGYVY